MPVYSRQLFAATLDHGTNHSEGTGPDSDHLWVVKMIGAQVPNGAVAGVAAPGWAAGALFDQYDNSSGSRPAGFPRDYFVVIEPGATLGFGWVVAPGAGTLFITGWGYLLPYP